MLPRPLSWIVTGENSKYASIHTFDLPRAAVDFRNLLYPGTRGQSGPKGRPAFQVDVRTIQSISLR